MKSDMELCRAGNEREFGNINDRLDRIEVSMDKIEEAMTKMGNTLSMQHESLLYHIRRTDLLESQMVMIQKTHNQMSGALKFISVLATIVSIIITVKQFIWGKYDKRY